MTIVVETLLVGYKSSGQKSVKIPRFEKVSVMTELTRVRFSSLGQDVHVHMLYVKFVSYSALSLIT